MYTGMNYINGKFSDASKDFSSLNPATEEDLGFFPLSSKNQVAEAVDAARCAFNKWRSVSRVKRSDYFDGLAQLVKRDRDRLIDVISLETGKTLNESAAEVTEALHMFQLVAGSGRTPYGDCLASELSQKDAYVIRKPKGVVAVVAPWNFPLAIGSAWTSAPAILEGNCVVHKPSEYTPMIAQIMAELYHEAGFPAGVYNLVHGMDDTGRALVHDGHVDCVLFTGSAEVGKEIRQHCASTWHKSCSCEMGSKSAVIVFGDADMNIALDAAVSSAFKLSGQRCVSSGRILIDQSIWGEFVDRFLDRVADLKTGDVFKETNVSYGPLISAEARKKVESYNEMVIADNDAYVLMNGKSMDRDGFFMNPFVYKCEWSDKKFLKEEVFGPHVALVPFQTVQEAIDIYNDTEYGLAVGVVTSDYRTMRKCREECDAGMIYINGGSVGAESHLPFSGVKKSGSGWPSAAGTYEAVTHKVAVTVNYEDKITWAQGLK